MPYIDSLTSAFADASLDPLSIPVEEARVGLASAQSAAERGRALATVAAALVRENCTSSGSSSSSAVDLSPPSPLSVRDECDGRSELDAALAQVARHGKGISSSVSAST